MERRLLATWVGAGASALFGFAGPFLFPSMSREVAAGLLGLALALALASIAITVWPAGNVRRVQLWRWRMNSYLVVALIAGLIFVGAVSGYLSDRAKGPIAWIFNSQHSPLGYSMRSGEGLWVDCFYIQGKNRSDMPIYITHAQVRSEITNKVIKLDARTARGGTIPASEAVLLPGASFELVKSLEPSDPSRSQGISAEQFRIEFASFMFEMSHGTTTFRHRFTVGDVDRLLKNGEDINRRALEDARLRRIGAEGGVVRRPPSQ